MARSCRDGAAARPTLARCRLDHDQPPQHRAVLARHLLPSRLAVMLAERYDAAFFLRRQQNAPAIIRHLDVVELRPAARVDRIRRAQVHQRLLEALRPHVVPPVDVAGMPPLERLQHLAIGAEIDVVGDLGRVVDVHDIHIHGRLPVRSYIQILSSSLRGAKRRSNPAASRAVLDWFASLAMKKRASRFSESALHRADRSCQTLVISNCGFCPLP